MTLPAHLQALCTAQSQKILDEAIKPKYEVEEIDCDEILSNNF
jgi:hypothetical protein